VIAASQFSTLSSACARRSHPSPSPSRLSHSRPFSRSRTCPHPPHPAAARAASSTAEGGASAAFSTWSRSDFHAVQGRFLSRPVRASSIATTRRVRGMARIGSSSPDGVISATLDNPSRTSAADQVCPMASARPMVRPRAPAAAGADG